MNAEHEITEGPVTLNENGLEMSFRALDASGHDAPWPWKELLALDYVRKA
jgi:hypothetical protein